MTMNLPKSNISKVKHDLEYDLKNTDFIIEKCKNTVYAQNLYSALCNNNFTKNELWPLLQSRVWHCSWRYAGQIIADIRKEGSYIDWYCSSTLQKLTEEEFANLTIQQQEFFSRVQNYVDEGTVTEEIRDDLLKCGWIVVSDKS